MVTRDKITDIFCTVDEFGKSFDAEMAKGELIWIIRSRSTDLERARSALAYSRIWIIRSRSAEPSELAFALAYSRIFSSGIPLAGVARPSFPTVGLWLFWLRSVSARSPTSNITTCIGSFPMRCHIVGQSGLKAVCSSS